MDITQTFYDSLASQYDKLFMDWTATTHEQALILDRIFRDNGFDASASVLDCACGIGTQSIVAFCDKYAANLNYKVADGWFHIRIIM